MLPLAVTIATALVVHLRRAVSVEERNRTLLLLAAVALLTPMASTEGWADLGFPVPRLGSVGILSFSAILTLAALRFRLFDKALSPSAALSAMIVAAVGGIAYLSIFRHTGTKTALAGLGALVVTLFLLAAARLVFDTMISRRDQLVRLATLGRFAAQLGHDLKNPLAALQGAAQFLLEERANGRSIDGRSEFLELMVQQIDRLNTAVDRYQRLGRIELVRKPVQVNELVRDLVALQKFANADEIALKADLAADLPACSMDRDLVAGALENLLQNAFEATLRAATPGTVTVRTALSRARQTPGVLLSVEDAGTGMSARTRERAFDDFYTTKATGSGLGLAFVRRVAEAHGGDVSFMSQEGAGTTARLFLPLE
jgi:signal transduction histidine kinase